MFFKTLEYKDTLVLPLPDVLCSAAKFPPRLLLAAGEPEQAGAVGARAPSVRWSPRGAAD